jgi:hypothetical protein
MERRCSTCRHKAFVRSPAIQNVQLSLDQMGQATVSLLLVAPTVVQNCPSNLSISFFDAQNNPISSVVNCTRPNQTLSVRVTNSSTGNVCVGSVPVLDRLAPLPVCPAAYVGCNSGTIIKPTQGDSALLVVRAAALRSGKVSQSLYINNTTLLLSMVYSLVDSESRCIGLSISPSAKSVFAASLPTSSPAPNPFIESVKISCITHDFRQLRVQSSLINLVKI